MFRLKNKTIGTIGFVESFVANESEKFLNKLNVGEPVGQYCPASQERQ